MTRLEGVRTSLHRFRMLSPVAFGQSAPLVAVLDEFNSLTCYVNGDGIADLSHGQMTVSLSKAVNPAIQAVPFDLDSRDEDSVIVAHQKLQRQISRVFEWMKHHLKQFDAVVYNFAQDLPFKDCQGADGSPLTPETIHHLPSKVQHWLKQMNDSRQKTVAGLKRLVDMGIPVYVAGGNDGPGMFNFYSLIPVSPAWVLPFQMESPLNLALNMP